MSAVSWRIVRRFIPLGVIAALLVAVVASGLLDHLSLTELKANRAMLTALVSAHPALSLLAYVLIYVLVVVACVPGAGFMTIAGGFLFGVWLGGGAALASCVVGATIVFQACRTAFGDWAAQRAGPVVQRIEAGFARHGFSYLLTLRLIPMVPFFATNVAAGLARVRLRDLVAATVIGTAPAAFVFAGLGAGLGVLFDHGAKADLGLIETPEVLLPLVGLGLLSLLPIAWRLIQARRRPR